MDFDDAPDERAFRMEVRAWLDGNVAPEHRIRAGADDLFDMGSAEYAAACRAWQRRLFEAGYAGLTWPVDHGGRGASLAFQIIFNQEQGRFSLPIGLSMVSVGMVGPTLIVHGTKDQQDRHLRRILRGDEAWCQLFSEPGAGSDLPSLRTRAEADGDSFVVNGQKVWTSFAQHSDWAILLARTGPSGSGRAGITYFLCDMRSPGIEVSPLRQITGVAHFNEVFLTDVRIPAENVVGEVDDGWRVARTTLGSERATIAGTPKFRAVVDDLLALARRRGRAGDGVLRQELARAYTNARLLEFMGFRLQTALSQGRLPGPEASVLKLLLSRQHQLVGDLGVGIEGPAGTLWDDTGGAVAEWQRRLCDQFLVRIGGGTDEVQRNAVAERALGLPRDPTSV